MQTLATTTLSGLGAARTAPTSASRRWDSNCIFFVKISVWTVQVYSCVYNLTYSLDEIKLMLGQGAAQFQGLFKSQKQKG